MANDDRPDQSRLLWPLVVAMLLPVAYLLALGPMGWLYKRGVIPDPIVDILTVIYMPLGWAINDTEFCNQFPGSAYVWYLELFQQ